jgi:uncharacterized protein (DUF1810 family)
VLQDPYNLERFVYAQGNLYGSALEELQDGSKETHWIWFIFPQMKGLGRSETAMYYGIGSRGEGEAYLSHPVLGPRLIECTETVNELKGRTAEQIFGDLDSMKFRSSMTLFAELTTELQIFDRALDKFFEGVKDSRTIHLLTGRS